MNWWIILGLEVILMVGCFFWSKWWIKNKSTSDGRVPVGRNEYMVFGQDSPETINNMVAFAKEIFSKEEILKSDDESDGGFTVQVSCKNNMVTKVVVKTNKTNVTYDGKNVEVTNTANSKGEVIIFLTLMSWTGISLIPWMLSLIVIVAQIFIQIAMAC